MSAINLELWLISLSISDWFFQMKIFYNFSGEEKVKQVLFHCGSQETKSRNLKIRSHRRRDCKNLLYVKKYEYSYIIWFYIYIYVSIHIPTCILGGNSRLFSHNDGKKEICMWGHIFLVKEQSQPVTKCSCWLAFPASTTGFSFTLHTKVILQFASYFPRL